MKSLLPSLLASALLLIVCGNLAANPDSPVLKIAVVDLEKVFSLHPLTDAATKNLNKDREEMRASFKEKSEELKKVLQSHQELIRAKKRTEAAELLKKANEVEKAIATLQTTQKRDLEEKFRKEKAAILADIREAVAKFNAEGQYALILDKSGASAQGLPHIIHAPGADDITDQIVTRVRDSKSP